MIESGVNFFMLKSKMKWNFTYKGQQEIDQALRESTISPTLQQLLQKRGITSVQAVANFLTPSLADLHDPALLSGVAKAKERIEQALANDESILVFGDYDADGVSATALLVEALREIGAMCDYYIPNRFTEGYGPNEQAFRDAHEQGFGLIITVDTGISAFEAAQLAADLGIDLIITDHHEAQGELPIAHAIVHPKCSESYPFKELAGVGVAFKLAQYLLGYFPEHLLDFVVIGTIADLVPLVDENRVLAAHGLTAISNTKRPGLQALKEVAGIQGTVTEEDIGFLIGPRINAVGRLQTAYPAVELLLTEDVDVANRIATEINQINQDRKQIVTDIAKEAIAMVEANQEANKNVIIVAKEGWNEGVLGIVASKLVRTYQRPAICLTIQPDKNRAKGSARSITAFNLFENGMKMKDLFLQFGGHAQAAGMSLPIDHIDLVRDRFNEQASEELGADDYKEQLDIEAELKLSQIDLAIIQEIDQLAPFGMANPKPLFHLKAQPSEQRQIGALKNHLKVTFAEGGHQLNAVGFGMGEYFHAITREAEVEAVGYLQINEWNGKKSPQLMLQDISVAHWQLFDYRGTKRWEQQIEHVDKDKTICLRFQAETAVPNNLPVLDFSQWEQEGTSLQTYRNLIVLDLPNQLEHLTAVLSTLTPGNIFTCYRMQEDHYMASLPSREDFKWFYAMLIKRGHFNQKTELTMVSKHKGWKINKTAFIIKVFAELEFVKITDDEVKPNAQVVKRDLTESSYYQQSIEQSKVEQLLYYSNYRDLKQWLSSQLEQKGSIEEEVAHGL